MGTSFGVDSHGGWCFHRSSLLATGTCQTPMAFQCVVAMIPDSCEFCAYNLLGISEARRNLVNCMYMYVHMFQKKGHTLKQGLTEISESESEFCPIGKGCTKGIIL